MNIKTILILLLALSVVSCGTRRPDPATRAQTELVGMSKKELLSCAGVPIRQTQLEDMEFFVFKTESLFDGNHTYCQATVALKNGRVEKISYEYRYAIRTERLRECALIVQRCLTP